MRLVVDTSKYLLITPNNYIICDNVRHIINTIRPYCNYLKNTQLNNFNKLITRHIERQDWRKPIKKQQYIKQGYIYVIKLTSEEVNRFYE